MNVWRRMAAKRVLRLLIRHGDSPSIRRIVKESSPQSSRAFLDVLTLLAPEKPLADDRNDTRSQVFSGLVYGLSAANVRELTPILLRYSQAVPFETTVVHALAILGDVRAVPVIDAALVHPNEYVRSYAVIGIAESASQGFGDQCFFRAVFPMIENGIRSGQLLHEYWSYMALLRMDRDRAEVFLTTPDVLKVQNRDLHNVLKCLRESQVDLPAPVMTRLLDEIAAEPESFRVRESRIELLMALAIVEPEAAINRATPLLDHEDDDMRRGASEVIARANGLRGPLFECTAEEYRRFAAPAKLMVDLGSATFQLEANGISALFCNFHNEEWRGFVRAYREIGATRSAAIIEEFSRYQESPGVVTDRVPGLEESSEEAEERLKHRWYADEDRRDKLMLEYVLRHREHFQLPLDDRK